MRTLALLEAALGGFRGGDVLNVRQMDFILRLEVYRTGWTVQLEVEERTVQIKRA